MDDLNACITRAELCGFLRISPKTSRRMDREGRGPKAIRVSPRITRYPVAEVVEFMAANGLSAPAEIEARVR